MTLMTELTSQALAESISNPSPPSQLSDYQFGDLLKAMWLVERGHFDAAHSLAQKNTLKTVRGYTPICTASRVISTMRAIGTDARRDQGVTMICLTSGMSL